MAERRMFAKTIIDSDEFLDMPLSTQALYFHLSMRADDDGFINNPKKIQRMIGATDGDAAMLIAKRFILAFQSGVIVIKHWRINNYLRTDRYHETVYQDEKSQLIVKPNGAYSLDPTDECLPVGIPSVDQLDTQNSIGKNSIGKDIINIPSSTSVPEGDVSKKPRFTKPTVDEIRAYCLERKNNVDPQNFYDFYEAKGWMVGKNHMKDWRASVRTWEKSSSKGKPASNLSLIADGSDRDKYKKTEWD